MVKATKVLSKFDKLKRTMLVKKVTQMNIDRCSFFVILSAHKYFLV